MKYIYLLLIVIFTSSDVTSQNFSYGLKVLNPNQGNWTKTPAYFQSVDVTVTPLGLFSKVDITAEVSAKYTALQNSNDSLEIEYKFSLPEGSIIHEAFLWMNNFPVRGELYEKGRAQFIYESLVSRRIDPLIVYKVDRNSYEARIFPVLNPAPRKFLLSVLVPNTAINNGWKLPLNLDMFRSDIKGIVTPVKLNVANNTLLGTPSLNNGLYSFTANGALSTAVIPADDQNEYLTDAVYFTTNAATDFYMIEPTANPNDFYYQLSIGNRTQFPTDRKILFVVDYTTDLQDKLTYKILLDVLRTNIGSSLTPTDSFCIIYTDNGGIHRTTSGWEQATAANIHTAFMNIPATPLNHTALTEKVIDSAIAFLNGNGQAGTLMLFSNSKYNSANAQQINQFVNTLKSSMLAPYRINVMDVNSTANINYNTLYSINNKYFLSNLSLVTGGYYYSRFPQAATTYYYYQYPLTSFSTVMEDMMQSLDKPLDYVYLTKTGGGNSYYDYKISNPYIPVVNERYMEIGKLQGPPSDLTVVKNAGLNGATLSDSYNLPHSIQPDSILHRAWGYELISRMINQNNNNLYTSQIVTKSLAHHVLCEYTAFLALEPDTIVSNVSNSSPTSVPAVQGGGFATKVHPNPFSEKVYFMFEIPQQYSGDDWSLIIYDLLGRTVSQLNGKVAGKRSITASWDGKNTSGVPVTQGVYIAIIKAGAFTSTVKIIKE